MRRISSEGQKASSEENSEGRSTLLKMPSENPDVYMLLYILIYYCNVLNIIRYIIVYVIVHILSVRGQLSGQSFVPDANNK